MRDKKLLREAIPKNVLDICTKLSKKGFQAYIVGGSVRNLLLGLSPKDFDIATDAHPEDIIELFPKSLQVGAKFGTVVVIVENDETGTESYEVTTFRTEAAYIDHRWPSSISYAATIDEDLSRRDFTMNALAIDPQNTEELLIDRFGGLKDLENGIIRAINDPFERIAEDALRSVRACRFASQLDFTIEEETFKAIQLTCEHITHISAERIRDELIKMLASAHPSIGIELLRKTGLLAYIIPELLEGVGVEQNEYHAHDVYTHLLLACEKAEKAIKMAALLHDIGKPRTKHGPHFYGHDQLGAQMAEEIMKRLKFPTKDIERTAKLIRLHMFHYTPEWKDAAVRRFIISVGDDQMLQDLFALRIADSTSNPKSDFDPSVLKELQERIIAIRGKEHALKITDLAINGYDLLQLGVKQGPEIGKILNNLFEKVIDDPSLNDRQILIDLVKKEKI